MTKLVPAIRKTLQYFAYFNYAPTSEEIYLFLGISASKSHLEATLEKMTQEGQAVDIGAKSTNSAKFVSGKHRERHNRPYRYTLPQYSIKRQGQNYNAKFKTAKKKVQKIQSYIRVLSMFPQIRLVGLSGSVAMMSAEGPDDVDIFIITARNRMWTGRFIAVLVAETMGLRRKRNGLGERERAEVRDKVCLNMFMDEAGMAISPKKRSEYVAHEVLQVKPLLDRKNAYNRFLRANSWVLKFFPNAEKSNSNVKVQMSKLQRKNQSLAFFLLRFAGDIIEDFLKHFQLALINRHRTTEIITPTQLWFHPDDYENKFHNARCILSQI